METFKVGIRFQPIGQDVNMEQNPASMHWALVFTRTQEPIHSLRVELLTDSNNTLYFPTTIHDRELVALSLGTYTGALDDIFEIICVHPMRGTTYDLAYNNCQHWAATLLVFLEAFAASTPERSFEVSQTYRYHNTVLSVLKPNGSDALCHKANSWLKAGHQIGILSGSAAVGAAAVVAEATTLVPAAGLAGWLGASVAVPTAGAVIAMFALPVAVGTTALVGGSYLYRWQMWVKRTTFPDPRKMGCPRDGPPLTRRETGELAVMEMVGSGISGPSAATMPSANVLAGSYAGVAVGAASIGLPPDVAAVSAPATAGLLMAAMDGVVAASSE